MNTPPSRLQRLGHGVKWGLLSTAATTVLQLALTAIMARLLLPSDYGLVATAGVALRFLSYFAQMGVGQALIQKRQIDRGDIGAALHVAMSIAGLFTLLGIAAAPAAQWFFTMPGLGWIIAALTLNFLLGAVGSVGMGLLRRRMDFRSIALVETGSYVVGYACVGLPAAWAGAHAWALVAATLTQSALSTAGASWLTLRASELRHARAQRSHFYRFGGRFAMIGFLEFLSISADAVVVGRFFGAAAVGLYSRAQLLASLPVEKPAVILTRVLFPFFSDLNSEREKQAVGVQLGLMLVGGYAFAVSAGVAVAAPDIVRVLLGAQWAAAVPVLQILAIGVGPTFVTHIIGTSFDSLGLLREKLAVQATMLPVLLAIMAVLSGRGLPGIAAAVVLAEVLRAGIYLVLLQRQFRFRARDWWVCVAIAVLQAGAVAAGAALMSTLAGADQPAWIRLGLDIAGSAAGAVVAMVALRPLLRHPAAIRAARARIPMLDRYLGKGWAEAAVQPHE